MKICWTKDDILWLRPNQEGIRLNTGEWVGSTSTTMPTGYYWLCSPFSGYHDEEPWMDGYGHFIYNGGFYYATLVTRGKK